MSDVYSSDLGSQPVFFFFFQAEDGIRDLTVTGVQTCALPIYVVRGRDAGLCRRADPPADQRSTQVQIGRGCGVSGAGTQRLLEAPVLPAIARLAAPGLPLAVFQTAVSIADTHFVGRLGPRAPARPAP